MTPSKVISGSIFTFDQLAGALDAGAEAEVFKHFRDLKAWLLAALISPGSAPCAWSVRCSISSELQAVWTYLRSHRAGNFIIDWLQTSEHSQPIFRGDIHAFYSLAFY